ncbi:hypothetical protein ScPMuIL_011895 [Solemya velum]
MASKIEKLEHATSDLQEQLRNSTADIQTLKDQLTMSTSDIQTLKEQLRISTSDIQTLQTQLQNAGLVQHIGTDCGDFKGTTSGVYKIKPQGVEEPFSVYCDIQTEGEGWTVFQRRQDGSVDFYRDWASYETGFGDLLGEFWLGNHFIYSITSQGSYELRVELSDFEGNTRYAHYDDFSVGDASTNYTLAVSGYSGNTGDSLEYHNNMPFTTQDRDHDWHSGVNCAVLCKGAWWYRNCGPSSLNGEYHHHGEHISSDVDGVYWYHWRGYHYSLRSTTMSVRRRN